MSDLLAIGASGVRAYQSALSTTSENIANAGSAGYTRRKTVLTEISGSIGRLGLTGSTGNGVLVAGVNRLADEQRSATVRSSGADLARTETGVTWLTGIEDALTTNQLDNRLTHFFNSAKAVAADPSASTPRTALLEAGSSVALAFAATARSLGQISTDLDSTGEAAADSLNTLGAALAKLNWGIGAAPPNSAAQANLHDQRDALLDQLSALSDLDVAFDPAGRVNVKLGGAGGPVLVSGLDSSSVTFVRAPAGNASFAVLFAGVSSNLSPSGGAVSGIIEGAQRIGTARANLDDIARDFVDGVNAVQAQGRDLDGNPGAPLFTVGATPTDFAVSLTSGRGIAAAAVGGGPRDNTNLAALEALRTSDGIETRTIGLIADNAAVLNQRKTVADAQSAIRESAIAARDQLSGVNLETEAVDLLRFQQAFQASSRVIQVSRETLQTILDLR